jgi:hypothetical protein
MLTLEGVIAEDGLEPPSMGYEPIKLPLLYSASKVSVGMRGSIKHDNVTTDCAGPAPAFPICKWAYSTQQPIASCCHDVQSIGDGQLSIQQIWETTRHDNFNKHPI